MLMTIFPRVSISLLRSQSCLREIRPSRSWRRSELTWLFYFLGYDDSFIDEPSETISSPCSSSIIGNVLLKTNREG